MYAYDYEPPRGDGAKSVWIVDDDRSIRWVLGKALAREGIPFKTFSSAYEVLQALAVSQPQVLVSDIRMPGESGLVLPEQGEGALSADAGDHHDRVLGLWTVRSPRFRAARSSICRSRSTSTTRWRLIRRAATERPAAAGSRRDGAEAPEMLGQAPAMQEVFRAIGRLSQSSATVLITGESGTGKELVARALHRHSPRAAGRSSRSTRRRFPKDLLESELFGHERGAFTGAQSLRRGRFEQAEGGTLFLDEIGDMPADLCRCVCCACWRTASITASAGTRRKSRACASSPPRTRISTSVSGRDCSVRICCIASTSSDCGCRHCASGPRTSRRWRAISCEKRTRARASSQNICPTTR